MGRKRTRETVRERLNRLAMSAEAAWAVPTHKLDREGIEMRLRFAYKDGYERRRRDAKAGIR